MKRKKIRPKKRKIINCSELTQMLKLAGKDIKKTV